MRTDHSRRVSADCAVGGYALPMTRRHLFGFATSVGLFLVIACGTPPGKPVPGATIDSDLLDVTVPVLHKMYAAGTYTVTQVVQWHLARIDRYNGVYGAIETVFRQEALADAAREDARGRA